MQSNSTPSHRSLGPADSIDPLSAATSKRVAAALEAFLAVCEHGTAPSRSDFLSQHPDIADQLLPCLESLDLLSGAAHAFTSPRTDGVSDGACDLGDFKLIAEIGRGGMGIVYEAEQLSLGRRVAVKVLPFAALLDRRRLERFQNEARAAALLRHPNIVSVHAVDIQRGVRFYAMELIEGYSLREAISAIDYPTFSKRSDASKTATRCDETRPIAGISTQYSTDRSGFYQAVAELGIQAAEGLHYAHGQGVIHRDVKPSNLLLDEQGDLHITDFGLAMVQNSAELTITGDVVGTLRYMSPEQLAKASGVDSRTDIYSLGATLYETLSGQPAIRGDDKAEVIRNVVESPPIRLQVIDSRIPFDLATIVHKCLAKSRDDRYATARELAEDLRRFRQQRPILARKSPLWKNVWRWTQRHKSLALAMSVALFALTTLAIAGPLTAIALRQALTAERQTTQRLASQAYDMRIRDAASAIASAHYARAKEMLTQCKPQDRDFEWGYLWQQVQADQACTIAKENIAVLRVALSPNGKQVAYANWYGHVHIYDREQCKHVGNFSLRPHGQAIPLGFVYSADGQWLFAGGETQAVLWSVEQQEIAASWTTDGQISAAAISLDSSTLALGFTVDIKATVLDRDPVTIELLDIATLVNGRDDGEQKEHSPKKAGRISLNVPSLSGLQGRVHTIEFAPDGNSLAACSNEPRTIRRWTFPSLQDLPAIVVDDPMVDQFVYLPDRSDIVAVASGARSPSGDRSTVSLYAAGTGERIRFVHGSSQKTHSIGFSPDAQRLVIGDHDGRVQSWRTADLLDASRDGVPTTIHPHQARIYDLEATDSATVMTVAADGLVKEYALDPINDSLSGYDCFSGGIEFLGDGRAVGWGYEVHHNRLKLWQLSDGTLLKELDTGPIHVTDVVALPSGQELAYAGFTWRADKVRTEVGVWGLVTGERQVLCDFSDAWSLDVELSQEGDRLFATVGSNLAVIDLNRRELHKTLSFDSQRPVPIARKSGSDLLAVAETIPHPPNRIVFWHPGGKTKLAPLSTGKDAIWSIDFSPDGKLVAGTDTGDILLWQNIEQKTPPQRLVGHVANAYHVCFSPTGTRFASAGLDGTVRLWNADTGNELLLFRTNTSWNYHVTFSPDGRTMAYSGGNGTFAAPIRLVNNGKRDD